MKKRFLAVLSALTILTMGSMTALAASPTVGTAEAPVATQTTTTSVAATKAPADYAAATKASEGYKVEAVSQTTVDSAAVAVQNQLLNDVASIGTKLGDSTLAAAAKDSSKKVTATILSVVEVDPTTATVVDGKYVVTLSIADIAAGDTLAVLHYNGSAWETIVPTKVEAGKVTFATASLSPISVVKLQVTDVTGAPKTGETAPMAGLILVVGLAGAVICGKKYFAKAAR